MDDQDAFGSIADRIGFQLRRLDVEWRTSLADQLAPFGVTPARATALVFIALHEGCDQMALGRALGINRASTMKVVNELVAIGAVERRLGRDRRTNALVLTSIGHSLRTTFERISEAHDAYMLGVLSADEVNALRGILDKLRTVDPSKSDAALAAPKTALRCVK
jgi:DNA-binding MarR family transcriptional regulator